MIENERISACASVLRARLLEFTAGCKIEEVEFEADLIEQLNGIIDEYFTAFIGFRLLEEYINQEDEVLWNVLDRAKLLPFTPKPHFDRETA